MRVDRLSAKLDRWLLKQQWQLHGFTDYPVRAEVPRAPDPRLEPVDVVDRIDELVNDSLQQRR